MLIQLQDGLPVGHPVTEENLRQLFPALELPAVLTPELVEPLGFGLYAASRAPEITAPYERLIEAPPARDAAGVWRQVWQIIPMSAAERAEADAEAARLLRRERDYRLARSDYTQLPDAPCEDPMAWAAYRQALRDLPAQAGFPQQVTWPTPPAA